MFNKRQINIVEKTSGIGSKNLGNPSHPKLDEKTILEIIENYRKHLSNIKTKKIVKEKSIADFPATTTEDINKIIKALNPNKATGPDRIPLMKIKTAANVIDSHLECIINKYFNEKKIPETLRPIYKKDDREKIKKRQTSQSLKWFFQNL